jgi:GNAT superfamily N-acetyltransferase
MNYSASKNGFIITTDKSKINLEYVHDFLSGSYWSAGIPVQTVKKAVEGSLCFGVYHNDKQIGFARMITDSATFAYLADVFIDQNYRGKGLSKWLMEVIMAHPDLQGLRRIMLATKGAHGLYKKYGFTPITGVERWMQIHNADVYKKPL